MSTLSMIASTLVVLALGPAPAEPPAQPRETVEPAVGPEPPAPADPGPAPASPDPLSPAAAVLAPGPTAAPAPADPVAPSEPSAPADASAEPPSATPAAVSPEGEPELVPVAPATAGAIRRPHTYPDIPIRWRLDVALSGGSTVMRDTSVLAFTDADRTLSGLAFSIRADVPLAGGRVFLGGGLGYRWAAARGTFFEDLAYTDLDVHDVLALARASVRTVEGVDLYAEGGVGPGIALTELSSDEHYGVDRRVVPAFEALGGLALYLPKRWLPRHGSSRVSGGVDLGLGYQFHGRVVVRPTEDTFADAIETSSPDLGDIALRGFMWRLGVFIRFM